MVGVAALAMVGANTDVATARAEPLDRGPADAAELRGFLDGFMASEMARLDIPGVAVVVVRDGDLLSSTGYGFADREHQVPVDPATTLFGIGSVTKPLTAVAVLQQVEQGHIALDADVDEVLDLALPEFDGTAVTLGSLLTHTSGIEERLIGYWTRDADDVGSLDDFEADHVPSRFAATGEVHSYSNHNYGLAGLAVERVSGQDFVTYMDDHVFGPLGMRSTAFRHALPADLAPRVAVGYGGSDGTRRSLRAVYDHEYPAGEVVTTADDMARFMLALLGGGQVDGGRVMSPDTTARYLAPAYRPQPDMPGRTAGGLEEMWINDEHAVGHGGDSLDGFAAQMVLLPEHDTGIFVVDNVVSDEFRTAVVDAIFDEFYPDVSPEPAFVDLDADGLRRFAGTYQWTRHARSTADKVLAMTPPYNTYVDAGADGTLTVRWLGVDERWVYRPIGPTLFERVSGAPAVVDGLVLDPGDRISFTVDDGEVTYLHTSLHTIALRKVPFLGLGIVHLSVFGTIVIVFVLSLAVWPIGAFVRQRRHRRRAARAVPEDAPEPDAAGVPPGTAVAVEPVDVSSGSPSPVTPPRPTAGARAALWLEVGIAACLLLGTVAFFAAVSDSDVAFGPTPSLYLATGLISIAALVGPTLIPTAIGAWIHGWFTVGGRILYSLLALTAPYLLWWAITWNLLGFRF